MSSSILTISDIIQLSSILLTVVGSALSIAWYASSRFSRIDQRLFYVEKTMDELKLDVRELRKNK